MTTKADATPAAQWRDKGEPDPHGNQYDCERSRLVLGQYSDDELANGAFLNYDMPLNIAALQAGHKNYHSPIVWMTAVKDRIRWLSRSLVKQSEVNNQIDNINNDVVDALKLYEKAFEEMFSQCLSNGIRDAWGNPVNCTLLNEAHCEAGKALRKIEAK